MAAATIFSLCSISVWPRECMRLFFVDVVCGVVLVLALEGKLRGLGPPREEEGPACRGGGKTGSCSKRGECQRTILLELTKIRLVSSAYQLGTHSGATIERDLTTCTTRTRKPPTPFLLSFPQTKLRSEISILKEQWQKTGTPGGFPAKTGYPIQRSLLQFPWQIK